MENNYYKFKTISEKKQVMYELILLLFNNINGKELDFYKFYNIFRAIYRDELIELNKDLPEDEQIKFYNFDKLLLKAPKDWFRKNEDDEEYCNWLSKSSKDIIDKDYLEMIEYPLFIRNNILSPEAEEYIISYKSKGGDKQNVEQSIMAEIIKILRNTEDPISFKIYNILRSSVAAKDMYVNLITKRVKPHILSEEEYMELRGDIDMMCCACDSMDVSLKIPQLFDEMHDFIVGPTVIKYCRACGNPVWGEECVGGEICHSRLKNGEQRLDEKYIPSKEKVYFLKDGIIRYNSIPGIDELWLYKKLIERYMRHDFVKIQIYPGKDAEGDIKIMIGEYEIFIDLKGWRKSWLLREKIAKNPDVFKKTNFLFVPLNLKQFYSRGLDDLNRTLKANGLKTEAVSDRQLFSRIDDEITRYLNGKRLQADKIKEASKQIF